jgi:regulation of enolase protein 1 (concanavalin A-like superfamily)
MPIIRWDAATWLNEPPEVKADGDDLLVTTGNETDFWRVTGYGYVKDDGHALLAALDIGSAVEVTYVADMTELYDQAGVLVRVDADTWLKAGTELSDGMAQLSTVVTHGVSDWAQQPVPEWAGRPVTVRVSRVGDALTVRARVADEPWRMIRLAPLAPDAVTTAGPYCCTPTRAGLTVRFTRFEIHDAETDTDNT